MIVVPEFIAQIAMIVILNKRYKIWFDRLNIFSLGMPDGAVLPDEEILAQLKEELDKIRFRESLLEQSDLMSMAARTHKHDHQLSDEQFSFFDD